MNYYRSQEGSLEMARLSTKTVSGKPFWKLISVFWVYWATWGRFSGRCNNTSQQTFRTQLSNQGLSNTIESKWKIFPKTSRKSNGA